MKTKKKNKNVNTDAGWLDIWYSGGKRFDFNFDSSLAFVCRNRIRINIFFLFIKNLAKQQQQHNNSLNYFRNQLRKIKIIIHVNYHNKNKNKKIQWMNLIFSCEIDLILINFDSFIKKRKKRKKFQFQYGFIIENIGIVYNWNEQMHFDNWNNEKEFSFFFSIRQPFYVWYSEIDLVSKETWTKIRFCIQFLNRLFSFFG